MNLYSEKEKAPQSALNTPVGLNERYMKCRSCKREIPGNSIFCNWCGEKQLKERKKKQEIKVPKPRQLSSGAWTIQLRAEGQSVTEPTAALCTAKAKAIRAGFLEAKKTAPKMTVREMLERYIDSRRAVRSPSTIHGYETIVKTRFLDVLDTDISAVDWQTVINAETSKCGAKTLANAWGLVRPAMEAAGIKPPTVALPQKKQKNMPWLDYEQITVFLKALYGTPGELGALLALHSLRRSEILAMTAGKIDLKKQIITVDGAVVRGSNGMVKKETNKSAAGQREIPIMIPRLLELIPEDAPEDAPLIMCKPGTIYDRINTTCQKAGLPLVGVHGLRRSFASLAYHLKWDILTTMRIGGWDDPSVVTEIYTKLAARDVNENVEKMRDYYGYGVSKSVSKIDG